MKDKNRHLHPTLPGWIHRDYDPCAHCRHTRREHRDAGMCHHLEYANGPRCACARWVDNQ